MWVKRALIITPVILLLFLLQTFFWVPNAQSAADNEGRYNRIVFYMSGDPTDMNPWSSSTTNDSTLTQYLYEGLLYYNKDYVIEPYMSHYAAIHHEITAPVPEGMSFEDFQAHLKRKFGSALHSCEKIADAAAEPKLFNIDTTAAVAQPDDSARLVSFRKPATAKVLLKAPPRQGEITSAVEPDFCQDLYGQKMEKFLTATAGTDPAAVTPEVAVKLAKVAGLPVLRHSPIVEMRLRQGMYWTDGPFFSPAEKTWVVSLGGEIAGTVVADSSDEAVQIMRKRHDAPADAAIEARLYEKRFGNESAGPWWGRGPELTAKDPKITYDLIRNPDFGSPRLSSWADIKEVRLDARDPYRLEVVYSRLFSPALSNLTGAVIPYHTWNKTAWTDEAIRKGRGPKDLNLAAKDYNPMRALSMQERDFRHKPSSCGPMVLQPLNGDARPLWKSAEVATLRRNEFYWGRKPEFQFLDCMIFEPALGRETAEIAFLSGNMDIYTAREFQVARYSEMSDQYYVLKRETTTYEYLGFNCRKGPLANPKVRLALSMAIDVGEIIKYVAYDQGQRIAGPAYPVLPWYDRNYRRKHEWRTGPNKGKTEELPFIPYSIDEARAILDEEGFKLDSSGTLVKDGEPFKIRLVNSAGGGTRADIALLARENWRKLGVKVELEEYEWNVFIAQYALAGNFDVLVLGWSGGLSFDKRQLFHSDFQPPRGYDFVGYASPRANELMDRILNVYDPEEQIRLSHEIFKTIADDCPYVFLHSPYTTSVMDRRIVWRKEAGTDDSGKALFENRPVNHKNITTAKATLWFFVPELKRLDERLEFTEQDRER